MTIIINIMVPWKASVYITPLRPPKMTYRARITEKASTAAAKGTRRWTSTNRDIPINTAAA